MRVSRRACDANTLLIFMVLAVVVFTGSPLHVAVAQQADSNVAGRILGPQWKQLSRRAGMIFAGTVLASGMQIGTIQSATSGRPDSGATAAVPIRFRVDGAIAGVKPGQILTVHEWVGASSMQRPMRAGEHILIFLYPLSRLGLTSPVGGSLGQVQLDGSGKYALDRRKWSGGGVAANESPPARVGSSEKVSVLQLERAIRSAREE